MNKELKKLRRRTKLLYKIGIAFNLFIATAYIPMFIITRDVNDIIMSLMFLACTSWALIAYQNHLQKQHWFDNYFKLLGKRIDNLASKFLMNDETK